MYSLYSKKINNFPKGNEWYFLILLSLLGIVLNTAFFTKGLELTTPAHASLISCMIPVITFLFAWIAGFLIGVGLMVMGPYYLDGFDSAFRFTSAAGWFMGSFIMMYGDREPYSDYLKKLRW